MRLRKLFRKKYEPLEHEKIHDFLNMISPSAVKFYTDYFICGNTYRSVWAIREYPTSTEELALLRYLGEKENVTLKIYSTVVTPIEERKIISNATNKQKMKTVSSSQMQETIEAQVDIQDLNTLIANMHRSREPLVHTAVFLEMIASDLESLNVIQSSVFAELTRSKMNVDKLFLRQKEGFISVMPSGYNAFKEEFERVLPASSVANLFPFNYSGKTDPNGFYIGSDKYGSNIIVDFNRRTEDVTNSNIIILGNSGQGKSYLLKGIVVIHLQSNLNVIVLDPESEYADLTQNLGGDYIDLTSGQYIINVLEPKLWTDEVLIEDLYDEDTPAAFKTSNALAQHISFLKDFFKTYKTLSNAHIDTLEIMLKNLYDKFEINDETDLSSIQRDGFPILEDLYNLIDFEYKTYNPEEKKLYDENILREILLAIYSICKGSESRYFNGYTNIKDGRLVTFGVKGLLNSNENLRNALLFNVLSYMSNELLTKGNTVGALDEFYLFLTNLTAVEYIRNFMKRVRKKDSSIILASQNLEDFNIPKIREYTKPLFSIPSHQFLFNAGSIDKKFYMDTLQLEESEFELIRYPQRGICLYKCGNERYNLKVEVPEYKAKLFGEGGGR
ncbi:DUF87 domain-containing protein [Erysipelothrix rhusiopathiae]|nr:DUF87 domain-containing protein [Erysipelothrix rhusiopathiae]